MFSNFLALQWAGLQPFPSLLQTIASNIVVVQNKSNRKTLKPFSIVVPVFKTALLPLQMARVHFGAFLYL